MQSVVRSDPIFITHWLKEGGEALACSSDKCITPINPVSTEVLNADTHTHTHSHTEKRREKMLVRERWIDKRSKETIKWEEKDSDR